MRIGFAGAGNMAAAMARGWAKLEEGEEPPAKSMAFADAGSGRAAQLASEVEGEEVADVRALPQRSDVIVLTVKRTALDELAGELEGDLPPLISVLAGVPLAQVQDAFPDTPVLRAMPNLAVEVRRGVTCYVPSDDGIGDEVEQALTSLLGHLGALCAIEDELIDAATAIMSSSPAYLAVFSQALVDAAQREGLNPKVAHSLVSETMAGTAELLHQRGTESVRAAVASPGGATEAGLAALAERDLEAAIHEAVRASMERMRR